MKGSGAAWSVSLQQLPLLSLLPPVSLWSEDRERLCNCIQKSWVRMRQVRGSKGRGGPFSSSAQHKPLRKWLTLLIISMKDKHQGNRHWGYEVQLVSLAGRFFPCCQPCRTWTYVFIKKREGILCVIAAIQMSKLSPKGGEFQGSSLPTNVKTFLQW